MSWRFLDTMSKNIAIVLTGQLELWEQEGGHCFPDIKIGDESVTGVIEEMIRTCGIDMESGQLPSAPHEGIAKGLWIMTLVRYRA